MSRTMAVAVFFAAGVAVATPVARGAAARRHVNLPGRAVQAPFSDAVVVGDTVYLTLYDRFNAVYRGYFGKDVPARAFIGSGPLLRGGHFEMQGIAVRR